jgi:hypothetical protein
MLCDGSYQVAVLSAPPRVGGDCATCGQHFDTLAGTGVNVPGHSPMFRVAPEMDTVRGYALRRATRGG